MTAEHFNDRLFIIAPILDDVINHKGVVEEIGDARVMAYNEKRLSSSVEADKQLKK